LVPSGIADDRARHDHILHRDRYVDVALLPGRGTNGFVRECRVSVFDLRIGREIDVGNDLVDGDRNDGLMAGYRGWLR
jgi:hypothetical protein